MIAKNRTFHAPAWGATHTVRDGSERTAEGSGHTGLQRKAVETDPRYTDVGIPNVMT